MNGFSTNGGSGNNDNCSNTTSNGSPLLYLCLILRYQIFFVKIINSDLFFEM